ncbi:Virus attachment protein p12 family, partial [Dysosmobacter welbionis]
QAPDRRVGAQRAGADHDDLRPGRRAHAGLRHSAALWPAADPDAAGPVTAAESAVSPQPAAAGAD